MHAAPSVYAALILPDASGLAAAPYLEAARKAVLRLDADSGAAPVRDEANATIQGDTLCLHVEAQEFSDFGPRILFTVTAAGTQDFEPGRATRLLSDTLRAALAFSDADIVEWGAPDTLLDTAEFLRACHAGTLPELTGKAPRATGDRTFGTLFRDTDDALPLAPPSALTARLLARCDALRNKEPADLRMDATSWAMTGTVACIAPPIGASMTVLGLVRGFDFRRVTQALSLTAVFVLLQNQGAISHAAQSLLH